MSSFVDHLPDDQKSLVNQLRKIIKDQDSLVREQPGKIMSAKDALCYTQEGVFKYGLTQTKTGYSFHSMVMYANKDLFAFAKSQLVGVKMQKGCINIPALEPLDLDTFQEMLRLSAAKDFSPVIAHYQSRK